MARSPRQFLREFKTEYYWERNQLLLPGEQLVLHKFVHYFGAYEQLEPRTPKFRPNPVDLLLGDGEPFTNYLLHKVFLGISLRGWPGCLAQQMATATQSASALFVTDRRLLLLSEIGQLCVKWEMPLGAVQSATRRPRAFQADRVMLVLSDGSEIALVIGMLGALVPRYGGRVTAAVRDAHL